MFKFKELLLLRTQFVFLSGTLPYSFQEYIARTLHLDNLLVIRASCSRPNISYVTSVYRSNKEEERIVQIRDYILEFQVTSFLTSTDKVLIFCATTSNIELVANTLHCSRYYASLSNEEKEETLCNFRSSSSPFYSILVCSTALQEGFDYSTIRLVIFKDFAYSFLGFLQGSSRGGRDGLPCTSMFFFSARDAKEVGPSVVPSSTSISSLLDVDKSLVRSYLLEKTCRRRQISLYIDREPIEQCSTSDNKCDLCLARSSATSEQVSRVQASIQAVESKRLELIDLIASSSFNCIFCMLLQGLASPIQEEHITSDCLLYKDIEELAHTISGLFQREGLFKLAEDSCCFTCLFPTVICSHLKLGAGSCFDSMFMFRILSTFYLQQDFLGLVSKGNIPPQLPLHSFVRVLIAKVFIQEIDTEGLLVFKLLTIDF
jgi:superfamily II DNA helicase RecQ